MHSWVCSEGRQSLSPLPPVPVLVGAEKLNAGAAVVVVVPKPPKAPGKHRLGQAAAHGPGAGHNATSEHTHTAGGMGTGADTWMGTWHRHVGHTEHGEQGHRPRKWGRKHAPQSHNLDGVSRKQTKRQQSCDILFLCQRDVLSLVTDTTHSTISQIRSQEYFWPMSLLSA